MALNNNLDTCAICGGELGDTVLAHDRPDRFERAAGVSEEKYRRAWVGCLSCGSATNRQKPENLRKLRNIAAQYYEVDFSGSDIGAKYSLVMSLPPHKSDNAGRVDRIIAALTRWESLRSSKGALSVLDIGAGTGVFLSRFLGQVPGDWTGVALEPDPHAADHLRSLELFDVKQELFTGQPELHGFKLLTLNKVLEHIQDPKVLLEQVAAAIDPAQGLIYVEVPDVMTIGRRPPTDNILGALHCHLYSPTGLVRLLDRAGLVVLDTGRVFEPSGKLTAFAFATCTEAAERLATRE